MVLKSCNTQKHKPYLRFAGWLGSQVHDLLLRSSHGLLAGPGLSLAVAAGGHSRAIAQISQVTFTFVVGFQSGPLWTCRGRLLCLELVHKAPCPLTTAQELLQRQPCSDQLRDRINLWTGASCMRVHACIMLTTDMLESSDR